MEVTKKSRTRVRINNSVFVILFLACMGLLFWLSHKYDEKYDWTATSRHTLSQASVKVLEKMPQEILITCFASENNVLTSREEIESLIQRYKKHKADIKLTFIDPNTQPDTTRKMGIMVDGELIIEYQGRSEHVTTLKEEPITNALQRLLRSSERHVVFISGHGERNPKGQANHDYGLFSKHLASKGIKTSRLNLSEQSVIMPDTAVLVIAGPQIDYLDGEVALIRQYVKGGGNLLWLHDPGKLYNLDKLAADLNIRFVVGTIVDPTTQLLQIDDPSISLITRYGDHAITRDFNFMTLFPHAAAIQTATKDDTHGWREDPFLLTAERSWAETGAMQGVVTYQQGTDTPGPLTLGIALERDKSTNNSDETSEKNITQQRSVVIGDGDFLSNAALGNQGNQDLGYNILNWLSHDDNFISIPISTTPDANVQLSETTWIIIGAVFMLVLPALLVFIGIFVWIRRRNR